MRNTNLLLFILFICIFSILNKKSYAHLYLQTSMGYNNIYGNFNFPNSSTNFPMITNNHINNFKFGITSGYNLNKLINIYFGWNNLTNTNFSKTVFDNTTTINDYFCKYKSDYIFIGLQTLPHIYKNLFASVGISLGSLYNRYNFSYYQTYLDKQTNSFITKKIVNNKFNKYLFTTSLDLGLELKATYNLSLVTNMSYIYSINTYNSTHNQIISLNLGVKIYIF